MNCDGTKSSRGKVSEEKLIYGSVEMTLYQDTRILFLILLLIFFLGIEQSYFGFKFFVVLFYL